jgi:protein O-mannosyl-transferase
MNRRKMTKKIKEDGRNNVKVVKKSKNLKNYLFLSGIIILTIAVFSSTFKNEFINFDDNKYITGSNYIKDFSLHGFKEIFKSYFIDELPLTLASFTLDYKIWKLDPVPYHIENVVLHIINILLVFILIKKITKKEEVALITALLFAVHPFRTESVVWAAERKDMLMGLFYLSSIICYSDYIRSGYKIRSLIFAFILAALSLMSKFTAVTIPLVLILIDYYFSRKISLKLLLEKIPFLIMPLISGIIHYTTVQSSQLVTKFTGAYNFVDCIFFAGYSIFYYLTRLLFPFNLSALHAYPIKINGILPAEYYVFSIFSIIIIILVVILIYKAKQFRKELVFGFVFFLITISLVLQIIPFGGHVIVAERYTYLPYMGLFFLIGQIFYWLNNDLVKCSINLKQIFKLVLISFVCAFCVITYNRNKVWKNSYTLFSDVIEKDPASYFAYNNRSFSKFGMNDIEGALQDLNKSIELNPGFIDGYYNRGNIYNQLKIFDKALSDFDRVLKEMPKNAVAYNDRGNSKIGLHDYKGSIDDFTKAILLKPDFAIAYNNRGSVLLENIHDLKGAISDFTCAIKIDINYGMAYLNRGICYLNLREFENACPDLQKASQLGYPNADELLHRYCVTRIKY